MSIETPFRIALLVIMSISMSIAVYHRWRSTSAGERISYAEEGYPLALTLRLAGAGLCLVTLAYLFFPASVAWAALSLSAWCRWGAVGGAVACTLLMAWTLSSLGRNLTDTVVVRNSAQLVTEGPYRWVRHPYYVVAGLLMLSVTLLTANGLIGAASLFVMSLLAFRTPQEERRLIQAFGDPYRQYMARTGRFLPRVFR